MGRPFSFSCRSRIRADPISSFPLFSLSPFLSFPFSSHDVSALLTIGRGWAPACSPGWGLLAFCRAQQHPEAHRFRFGRVRSGEYFRKVRKRREKREKEGKEGKGGEGGADLARWRGFRVRVIQY